MAHVTGNCGAWKEIYDRLRDEGMPVTHPRELHAEIEKIKDGYDKQVAQFFVDVTNEIAAFEKQVIATQSDIQQRIEKIQLQGEQIVAGYNTRLEYLQEKAGFFRRILNRIRIAALLQQWRLIEAKLLRQVATLEKTSGDLQRRLDDMKANKDASVNSRRDNLDRTIMRLENILHSKEVAGAQAEFEVADHLAKLPECYHVFHDVRLKPNHYMRDSEGISLQSAQCDHVVLAPFGVFVVETKNWSQQFVDGGDGFSPFKQVERANRLCYALLKEWGSQTKVRSVVATKGKLPKADHHYVKVMRPEELNRYILWFQSKEQPMEPECFEDIRRFLTQLTGSGW